MFTRLVNLLPILFTLVVMLAPMAFGQESGAGEGSSQTTQYVLGGLAIVVLVLYMRRRNKRKSID